MPLGSPVFRRIELHPPDGPTFTLNAEGCSPRTSTSKSAILNGVPYERPWFPHKAVHGGGELTLVMGPRPNTSWGSRPEDAPPSMVTARSFPNMELKMQEKALSTQSILTAVH